MLVPVPPPAYTLAPSLPPLRPGEQRALETCLESLTGRVGSVVVTGAGTTLGHHVLELMTPAGSLLVIERIQPDPPPAGPAEPPQAPVSRSATASGASTGRS